MNTSNYEFESAKTVLAMAGLIPGREIVRHTKNAPERRLEWELERIASMPVKTSRRANDRGSFKPWLWILTQLFARSS